jgi:hypothetical protein
MPQPDFGFAGGVNGDGQRLQESPFIEGDGIGETVDPVLGSDEVRGEPPLSGAILVADVLTEMVFPPEAEGTGSAGDHRFNGDPISNRYLGYCRADLNDLPGDFVADGHGKGGQGVFSFVEMNVSAANAAGLDPEKNVMLSHGREGSFHELHFPGSGDHGHGVIFHQKPPAFFKCGIEGHRKKTIFSRGVRRVRRGKGLQMYKG